MRAKYVWEKIGFPMLHAYEESTGIEWVDMEGDRHHLHLEVLCRSQKDADNVVAKLMELTDFIVAISAAFSEADNDAFAEFFWKTSTKDKKPRH